MYIYTHKNNYTVDIIYIYADIYIYIRTLIFAICFYIYAYAPSPNLEWSSISAEAGCSCPAWSPPRAGADSTCWRGCTRNSQWCHNKGIARNSQ